MHLLRNGHFDRARMSESHGGGRGEDSFGNHAVHVGNNVREILAAAEFGSDATVSREAAGTSENKISEPGKTRHGVGAPPTGDY
jgi:hypothetical protein